MRCNDEYGIIVMSLAKGIAIVHRGCNSALTVVPDKRRDLWGRTSVDIIRCKQPVSVRSLLPLLHYYCGTGGTGESLML